MMKKKDLKVGIDLPKHVEDYLRKNADSLLNAPAQYVLDTFNMLMKLEDDYENSDIEMEVLHALLVHFKEEAEGTKKGILGVIEGGKSKQPNKIADMFNGPGPEIKGVIADIRSYMDIPESESTIIVGTADNVKKLIPKVDFLLNGKLILVAYYMPEKCISFFHVTFDEKERAVFSSIQDDEEFEMITGIWKVLKEEDFSDVASRTQLH